jgi:hypothetical protein
MNRFSPTTRACGAALLAGFGVVPALAADNEITTAISGYGTVAATVTDNSDTQYISSLQQFKGATKEPDIGAESRLGLQGVVTFDPQFSVTAQALAKRRGNTDFDIGTEWLFGQYTPMPGLDLRLGRVAMPTFLVSDSRNVGYAATWLRAPNEVYTVMPFTTLDGGQAIWRATVGSVALTSQLSYGKTSVTVAAGTGSFNVDAKSVVSLAFVAETGNWTLRLADSRMSLPTSIPLSQTVTLNFTNKDTFLSAGVQYDDGKVIVLSEFAKRSEDNAPILGEPLSASASSYVAAGYRIGSFTPMVRYSHVKYGKSLTAAPVQNSEGLILRYDAFRNVAFKAQIDRYDASNPTAFISTQATTGKKIDVLSVGADFVF